jgi:Kef-type K+ transport system membrane component KefB
LVIAAEFIGYGFFIPVVLRCLGMTLEISSIADAPLQVLVFFALLLLVRGVPALFLYRKDLPPAERLEMMFITATALPLLVALAEIGLRNGTMLPENAAARVGAGVSAVLVFPVIAIVIERRRRAREQTSPDAPSAQVPPHAE